MAQPTPYSRQYNFANYQTVNPATPLPAAQVDLELNSIKATLDQTLQNLKLIQRDDTALANNSVGQDQLKDEIFIGINPPAPWQTSHAYVANDTVTINGIFYRCAVSHTSGTFATDLAALDWTIIIDFNTVTFNLASAIHNASSKSTPQDQDEFPITDSSSMFASAKLTWANVKAGVFAALGPLIAAGNVKSNPVDADGFAYMDSASANATKVTTWSALKSTIMTALGALIAATTGKTTPVGADMVAIADSASSNATKMVTLTSLFAADFAAYGPQVAIGTVKSTPVDADAIAYMDSGASNVTKVTTFTGLKGYFKTYFDTLYQPVKAVLTALGALANAAGVLANDGSGNLSWAAVTGGETLLATLATTSGSTYTTPALPTTYNSFRIECRGVSSNGSGNLQVALSSDSGSSFGTPKVMSSASAPDLISGNTLILAVGVTANKLVLPFNWSSVLYTAASLETVKTGPTNMLQFSWASGAGDAGSILVYGVK